METPKFPNSIFGATFDKVYEPAEDTWILIDALEDDLEHLRKHSQVFMECGSGSGAVTVSLAKAIGSNRLYFTTDVNMEACRATIKCAQFNIGSSNNVIAVNTSFLECLTDKLNGSVDTLIFNPPYVPTEGDIPSGSQIDAAWAGGERGRQVIDRFIHCYIPKMLKRPTGCAYIVAIRENNIDEMQNLLISHGICGQIVKSRKAGTELLSVIRYQFITK